MIEKVEVIQEDDFGLTNDWDLEKSYGLDVCVTLEDGSTDCCQISFSSGRGWVLHKNPYGHGYDFELEELLNHSSFRIKRLFVEQKVLEV